MAADSATSNSSVAEALQFIEEVTRDVDSVQKRVLSEILSQNSDTEYLSRLGLSGSTDQAAFKSKVPVVSYEDIWPDIKRIANGDKSKILCSHPISEFYTSSGTSCGERKLIPTTDEDIARRIRLYKLGVFVVNDHVPDLDKGKGLYFIFTKAETKTPSGIVAQPVSSSRSKSEQFKCIFADHLQGTSPIEAILCQDTFQSMYTHLLCGLLMRRDVTRIGAFFASRLLGAIRFLQLNWRDLAQDIKVGTLNPRVTDPAIRARMARILRPDPTLAEFLSAEFRDGNWDGIITRIWPNTKCLDTIVTGTMAQYIPMLDHYSNGLPKVSSIYASSECFFGINLKPMCDPYEVSYTIMPNMAYFEFIPLNNDDEDFDDSMVRIVKLADVEIGKDYEIVVTTYAGLWRYRVGDILRVMGFHNAAPQFRFLRRKNVILSISFDQTNEAELHAAVQNASALLKEFGTSVMEYMSCVDMKALPGHYVIYWELFVRGPTNQQSHEVLDKCCLAMEESLSSMYRKCRSMEISSIGPLEIRVLKNGTFEELMNYGISNGSSISQYKVPRSVNSEPIVELLNARVVSAHFSPTAPHWSPERHFS